MSDIIDNGITASSTGMATAVIPVYQEGNDVKSDFVIFADKNIYPEHQRTVYYDTSQMQNFFGPEFFYTGLFPPIAERNARNCGISYLMHSMKDMYKGQLVIIGDASIKPYDTLNIQDGFREMFGMTYVGAVTHSMSVDAGFVTSIKADLITTSHKPESVEHMRVMSMAQVFTTNYMLARMSMVSTSSIELAYNMYTERTTTRTGDGVDGKWQIGLKTAGAAVMAGVTSSMAGGAMTGATATLIGDAV